jgi:hypothetical protein
MEREMVCVRREVREFKRSDREVRKMERQGVC